jgi:hypothetical protein
MAMSMGLGLGGDGLLYTFSEGCYVRLGISPDQMDSVSSEYVESFKKHETMFSAMAA